MKTKTRKARKTTRARKESQAQRKHDSRSGKARAAFEDTQRAQEQGEASTPPRDNVKMPAGE